MSSGFGPFRNSFWLRKRRNDDARVGASVLGESPGIFGRNPPGPERFPAIVPDNCIRMLMKTAPQGCSWSVFWGHAQELLPIARCFANHESTTLFRRFPQSQFP